MCGANAGLGSERAKNAESRDKNAADGPSGWEKGCCGGSAGERETAARPDEANVFGCCGPGMAKMMKNCSFGTAMKRYRWIFFGIFAAIVAAFLVSQVGGILGIIAFVRTL